MKPEDTQYCGDGGQSRAYRIQLAVDGLNFRSFELSDPVPLGRQLLAAAGLDPRGDLSLLAILPTGDFEDLRLDEPFDLRGRGIEKFVAFHTDRTFRLTLNGSELAWGRPIINGSDLYELAKVSDDQAVFLEVRGGEDKLITPNEPIDLTLLEVEHFITASRPAIEVEIIVNARPRLVPGSTVTYEQIVELAFPGYHDPSFVSFSMTYSAAASNPSEGNLGAGGVVKVKTGTIFNVTRTDKS